MINGVHTMIYSKNVEADRAFFRDVLKFPTVDAGHGWLIFALPPAELGAHEADEKEGEKHEIYFMCDDVKKTVEELAAKGVEFPGPISDQGWGLMTAFKLPSGMMMALYQPRHPTALGKR